MVDISYIIKEYLIANHYPPEALLGLQEPEYFFILIRWVVKTIVMVYVTTVSAPMGSMVYGSNYDLRMVLVSGTHVLWVGWSLGKTCHFNIVWCKGYWDFLHYSILFRNFYLGLSIHILMFCISSDKVILWDFQESSRKVQGWFNWWNLDTSTGA